MNRIVQFISSVVSGMIASTFAEGLLAPVLLPLLTGPRDAILVNIAGDFVGIAVGIGTFLAIEARRRQDDEIPHNP